MRLRLTWTAAALAVLIGAVPCRAQDAQGASPDEERVFVTLTDSRTELRGRLLRLDSETLSIRVDGKTMDVPIARVKRVQVKKRDSLKNGAIIGALWVGLCTATWCQQGMDEPANLPLDALLAAGMGALVGAGVDALFVGRKTIFEPGKQVPAIPGRLNPALTFSVRF